MWAKENLAHNLGAELAVRAPKDALTRAFLTVIGVVIGVAAVVTLVTLAAAA